MGCLNHNIPFSHWYANIHFSGKCNRNCYFCIGQFMEDLDSENNLNLKNLTNIDKFIEECKKKNITEIALTGTNTDPLLYKHISYLKQYLQNKMEVKKFRVTTNGVKILNNLNDWLCFDSASISFASFNKDINYKMMGGDVIDIEKIYNVTPFDFKINIVLSSYNCNDDLIETIQKLNKIGIKKINLREPYGQPNMQNVLYQLFDKHNIVWDTEKSILGNKIANINGTQVCYWDVHYTEVQSINLYASGRISYDYCITLGHSDNGKVYNQNEFLSEGRKFPQWVNK